MDKIEEILKEFDKGDNPTYREWYEESFEVDYEKNCFESEECEEHV